MTCDPTKLFGIKGRGRRQAGFAADITIFDLKTVGSSNRGERRFDLPDGGKRLVIPSHWVRYTVVNGVTT